MVFAEDLTPMFDEGDFATPAAWKGRVLSIIFDAPFKGLAFGDAEVESSGPTCVVQSDQVVGVAIGDELVHLGTVYTVTGVHPDGTGVTTLLLQETT
jgi:hypothetical protein